jgi:hypothetical protein
MLDQVARHGAIDLEVRAEGDLHIDAHHTVEDVGITLGQAVAKAVGDRKGLRRFGHAYCPLDEALEDACGFRRLAVSFSAAVLALGVRGAHARTLKSRSSRDALKDPDAQPGQSTPRPPKPDRGPNRTGDALQDPDSQPSMGSPRPPKTEQGSESDRRRPPGSRRATSAEHPAAGCRADRGSDGSCPRWGGVP